MLRRALLQRAAASLAASSSSRLVNRGSVCRVVPLAVSPLLRKAPMVGSLLAAGSTGAACAFCSAAAAPPSAVRSSTDVTWPRVTLYQYEPCPYCCKVKAVLDYLRIPYHVVEVNPLSKAETKAFTDYKKVPVLRLDDDEVVVDSSVIIARLRALAVERGVHQANANDDESGVSLAEEEAWRKWVDDKLIILTPPNIYRTVPEALQSFEYVLTEGKFTALERQLAKYSGAAIMYVVAKRAKKKYGIDDERAALYAALDAFVDAVGKERPFLGGAQPNTADLSVFGVLRAMEGLQTYDDVMQQSSIAPWFERMRAAVGPSTRVVEAA